MQEKKEEKGLMSHMKELKESVEKLKQKRNPPQLPPKKKRRNNKKLKQ